MTRDDARFMARALELAARGGIRTAPNPQVGAVVVRRGRVIGEGFHRAPGSPHAEVLALRRAGAAARGATLYVSLEPCSPHPKRTPPCTELLIRSGLKRVVAAMKDPNPLVHGRGLILLRRAGIEVVHGIGAAEAAALNAPFIKVHTRGLPYVVAKWAMTLDGKIAARTGDSRWISNERSRAWLHRYRDTFQAILVGSGTVLSDDPTLRGARTGPLRIVLDSLARTPLTSKLVRTAKEQPLLLVVNPKAPERRVKALERAGARILLVDVADLHLVFQALARDGIQKILVEGGGEVHASVLEARLADEACVFVAPKIIGGRGSKSPVEGEGYALMSEALKLDRIGIERIGDDVLIRGRFAP